MQNLLAVIPTFCVWRSMWYRYTSKNYPVCSHFTRI